MVSIMAAAQEDELTRLREQRLAALREEMESKAMEQMQAEDEARRDEEHKAVLTSAMKTILTPEARERLARLELSRPELALEVRQQLAALHSEERIAIPVNDASLKRILAGLDTKRHETSIRRI